MPNTNELNGIVVFWECAVLLVITAGICYLLVRFKVWRDNVKNRKQIDTREANKSLHKYDGVKDYLDNKKDRIN